MSAVFACWVHTCLGQEARPSKRHQTPQFAVPVFVIVVNVMRSMLNQKRGKLQEIDPERIQHIRLLFRIKYLVPGMIKEETRKVRKTKTKQANFIIHKSKVRGFFSCSSIV